MKCCITGRMILLYKSVSGGSGLWAEWKHVLEYGADALRCTDGQNFNGMSETG